MAQKKKVLKKPLASQAKGSSREPQTMKELLDQFGGNVYSLSLGDKIKGRVVKKEPGRVLIDIGGKSEGLVAEKAYKEAEKFIRGLKEGDEVECIVLVPETPQGYTILSLRGSIEEAAWKKIVDSYEEGVPLQLVGRSANQAGITVDCIGISGFIPSSQLGKEALKNPQKLIGSKFAGVVIDYDRQARKVILSEKEVTEADELAKARDALEAIEEGDIFEGEVSSIYDFGCFVRIEAPVAKGKGKEKVPLEGLVHVSELSWEKVGKPEEHFLVGDKVKVKVIGKKDNKLAFSIKQTQKDPWEEVPERYKKDQKIKGKVSRLSDFGAFVALEPGIEGLLHITKIPPGKKLKEGDEINVYIEDIDAANRKISLGLVLTEKPVGYK